MTIEQKREVIRKACIAANPEIVELKFGCAILWGKTPLCGLILNKTYAGNYLIRIEGTRTTTTVKERQITKIIGRPIRLADVVLAAKEKRKQLLSTKSIDIPEEVEDWMELLEAEGVENELEYLWYHWKFTQDNLASQEEPTVNFLYEILK